MQPFIFRVLLIFLGASCLATPFLYADDATDLEKLNGLSAVLPKKVELPSNGASPLLINAQNLVGAQDLLIPELIAPVRSGDVVLGALASLPFEWRYDEAFYRPENQLALGQAGELTELSVLKRGLAFPSLKDIDKPTFSEEKGAQALLWNINSIWWSLGAFKFDFQLLRLGDKGPELKLAGALERLYPKIINQEDKTEQLFRELVRFDSPTALRGLSYLSFRLYTAEEDFLWLYSVAIKATRELTGPNRTDTILRSGVSLDDLLVWSGNPSSVQSKFAGISKKLVPFRILKVLKSAGADKERCSNIFLSGTATSVQAEANWNFETEQYPQAANWLPTGSTFFPRDVIRLDLVSTNPFSLYGRQVLYVDKESMLPVYKIVFDRSGRHWKSVIGSFALVEEQGRSMVVPVYEIVVDVIRNQATLLEYTRARICPAYSADLKLQDFDPHHLGPVSAEIATKSKTKAAQPTPTAEPEEPADGILD